MPVDRTLNPGSSHHPRGEGGSAAEPALIFPSPLLAGDPHITIHTPLRPHGAIWGATPLTFAEALQNAILPSFAGEIALHRWCGERSATFDAVNGCLLVAGHPTPLPAHLLAREVEYHGLGRELSFARTNADIFPHLSPATRSALDGLHQNALLRGLDTFDQPMIRQRTMDIELPLGRCLAGIAAELEQCPRTALGIAREDDHATYYEWYLVDTDPLQAILPDERSESARLRFCIDVLEESFPRCRSILTDPLNAVRLLGARLGLITGRSDPATVYLMAPTARDVSGERLALVARLGGESSRIPGLEIGWAHHDTRPRPDETLYRTAGAPSIGNGA
jgi:hypothetical protein